MALIFILTSQFPFSGEPFLEAEIGHWAATGHRVVVAPSCIDGALSQLPDQISIDESMALCRPRHAKAEAVFTAPTTRLFRTDLRAMDERPGLAEAFHLARSTALTRLMRRGLFRMTQRHGRPDLVYSYWYDVECYAAILAKRDGAVGRVIARAHNSDVYAERRPGGWMPLKRQFTSGLDHLFPISTHAHDYLAREYGALTDRMTVNRLGVHQPTHVTSPGAPGTCRLLSLSNSVQVKRIDKIILGLRLAAERAPRIQFTWSHVGDGPVQSVLTRLARSSFADLPNVTFSLAGAIPHAEILPYLLREQFDVIVNASEFEGIPVSIMEAMSCGIPAIAPDVGGVSELVSPRHGWLMSRDPGPSEIAHRILDATSQAKDPAFRSAVRRHVANVFDAETNHTQFVSRCLSLLDLSGQQGRIS